MYKKMMVNKFAALALCFVTMLQIEVDAKPLQGENVSVTESSNPVTVKATNYKIETTPIPLIQLAPNNKEIVKREAKDDADLETAAGTNILRPLFVYRQQVEYRRRIKKNNNRGT